MFCRAISYHILDTSFAKKLSVSIWANLENQRATQRVTYLSLYALHCKSLHLQRTSLKWDQNQGYFFLEDYFSRHRLESDLFFKEKVVPQVNLNQAKRNIFTCGFSPGLRTGSVQWIKFWLFTFSKNYKSSDRGWVYQTKSVEIKTWNICNSLKSEKMTSLVETITWNKCNPLKSENVTSLVETNT